MLEEIKVVRDYLREEGRVIRQAPVAFIAGCLLVGAVVFGFVGWHFSARLDLAHDTIENQKTRIEQLHEELKGASPQLAATQARRAASRAQLLAYYVSAGSLLRREIPREPLSEPHPGPPGRTVANPVAVARLLDETKKWEQETADMIEQNFGVAAKEKFIDGSNPYSRGISDGDEYNKAIDILANGRKNLSILIETSAYDK
jgi:hypothetical protein